LTYCTPFMEMSSNSINGAPFMTELARPSVRGVVLHPSLSSIHFSCWSIRS
jgi:hypothetical protein